MRPEYAAPTASAGIVKGGISPNLECYAYGAGTIHRVRELLELCSF